MENHMERPKLGFFPLPVPEVARLKNCLAFASEFSATRILAWEMAWRSLVCFMAYRSSAMASEIDANRGPEPKREALESRLYRPNTMGCPVQPEAVSLLT